MSTPVKIYDSPLNASKWGQVAFGPDGKVHIVWEEDYYDSGGSDIFYMSYDGNTWEGPVKLKDSRNINAKKPDICSSQNGALFAVWDQDGEVYVREYDSTTDTWLPDERVATADYGAEAPCCAADSDGNVYITWHDYHMGRAWSRSKINSQWEDIKRMSGGRRSTQTGIAAGKDGQVWAIHREKQSNGEYKIYYSKRTKDTTWSTSNKMNLGGASQGHPHIAVGPDNVAVVTYADIDVGDVINILICTIDENQNPRDRVVLGGLMHYSRIALDNQGNKYVAWQIGPGDHGTGIMYKNNVNKEGLWNDAVLMPNSGGSPKLPDIAADDDGNIALVWASRSAGSEKNIWFSFLYPPPPHPPVNLNVDISINSFKKSPSITYNLSWEKNPKNEDGDMKEYRIYKKENDGEFVLLDSLTPATFSAVYSFDTLNNRIKFGISTVYLDGTESNIVTFGKE